MLTVCHTHLPNKCPVITDPVRFFRNAIFTEPKSCALNESKSGSDESESDESDESASDHSDESESDELESYEPESDESESDEPESDESESNESVSVESESDELEVLLGSKFGEYIDLLFITPETLTTLLNKEGCSQKSCLYRFWTFSETMVLENEYLMNQMIKKSNNRAFKPGYNYYGFSLGSSKVFI